ncbi:interleukin-10 receptor subunit beta isoform X2 [Buteo buteo]|uniref:interleukin-10 receptor subunit beta isoform X2 n=1 Tax=Buteo buteo TaxID=30397 RepID=UPI003EBCC397
MAAALRCALCGCLLLCVSGIVPKPQNARIISVNLHSTLRWDAPRFHKGNISYTVQSKSVNFPGDTYENVSTNLRLTECDVSSLSAYGDYVLQVRAESENNHSDWATVRFKPMDDTVIGPPDVKVKSESGSLHVDFPGPFAEHEHDRWPLKQYYGSWNYRILYWKKGSNTEFLSKPPSGAQFFSPLPQEEHLFYDKLTVISEESKNNSDETGDEASKTTEHLQDSEQEDSDSRIVPASEKA